MTSTTTGTGNLTVAAVNGKQAFGGAGAFGTGVATNVFDYFISNRDAAEWERGTGHMSNATTFVRDTVLEGSNGTSLVTFSAGTKDVTNDVPALPQTQLGNGVDGLVLPDNTVISSAVSLGSRNMIINGRFEIDQRNAGVDTVVADAAYGPDRWKMLGEDSNGKLKARDTTLGGGRRNLKLTAVTASKKYGIVQYVEGINCQHAQSKQVVFSFSALINNARMTNMRAAIIEWGSTEDTLTSDMVSTWGAGGTNPTLASNFTYKNTPVSLALTVTEARYSVSATLGSSFNNLALFIWYDGASNSANDYAIISDVQCEIVSLSATAPTPTPYEKRSYGLELALCQRYYQIANVSVLYVAVAASYSDQRCQNWNVSFRASPSISNGLTGSNTACNPSAQGTSGFAISMSGSSGPANTSCSGTVTGNAEL